MLRRRVFRLLLVLTLCGVPLWAQAFCFDAAAAKYHVSPLLIKSMAIGEAIWIHLRQMITGIKKRGKSKVPTTD